MGHKIVSMQMDEDLLEVVDRKARDQKITRTKYVHIALKHFIEMLHGADNLPMGTPESHEHDRRKVDSDGHFIEA